MQFELCIGDVRHEQERDAQPEPRLQEDRPETQVTLQGKTVLYFQDLTRAFLSFLVRD